MSSICESLWGSGVGKIYVVPHSVTRGFPAGSVVKNPPVKQETWVRSLGQEDPLEKEMQPTPVFLPGKSHEQSSLVGNSS